LNDLVLLLNKWNPCLDLGPLIWSVLSRYQQWVTKRDIIANYLVF